MAAGFIAETCARLPACEGRATRESWGFGGPLAAQPNRPMTAKVKSEAQKPKSPAPRPATVSTTPHEDTTNSITPMVGSPQKWEQERAEDERKEQHLKQVIQGICRGC